MFKAISKTVKRALGGISGVKHAPSVIAFKPRVEVTADELNALQDAVNGKIAELILAAAYYSPYNTDNDEETAAIVEAAKALGFPEVADFTDEQIEALCAFLDTEDANALHKLTKAVNNINVDEFTLNRHVGGEFSLGDTITRYYEIPDWIVDTMDLEAVGKIWREDCDGHYTRLGYFQFGYAYPVWGED